jgi:hypothetical protein
MPFHTEAVSQTRLNTMADVSDWISDTQRSLTRIPVEGVLDQGATFRDDEYFGDGDALFHFNQQGFVALCKRLGCRQDLLYRLKMPDLPSQILNDLLAQREIRESLATDEFVMDERTNTIIGMVSKSYVTYTNFDLLKDINTRLESLPENDMLIFAEAYGINTELTVRFLAELKHTNVKMRCGRGDDKSKVGLEFANSMVGTSSVRINYYLRRLLCSNGMMVTAAESVNRVFHAGKSNSFQNRMDRCFNEVVRNLDGLQVMLTTLGGMNFEPSLLARDKVITDQIFSIIPSSKKDLCDEHHIALRYPTDAPASQRELMRQAHDAQLIGLIPKHFGGEHSGNVFKTYLRDSSTVFDFINVFTEHAKEHPPAIKLEIEEKAGALAKYIANNAKKFC